MASTVIMAQTFGAVGDGVTDDSAAWQAAIDAAAKQGSGVVTALPGTYVVSGLEGQPGLTLDLTDIVWTRPAEMPNWTRTLVVSGRVPRSTEDVAPVRVIGGTIDGNRANQGAYDGYEQEQSHLLLFSGNTAGPGRLPVEISGTRFQEVVADGVHVLSNVDMVISDVTAYNCWRGGLVLSGGHNLLSIQNFVGDGDVCTGAINIEQDSTGWDDSEASDIVGDNIVQGGVPQGDFSGSFTVQLGRGSTARFSRVEARTGFFVRAMDSECEIRDSDLHSGADKPYGGGVRVGTVRLERCRIGTYAPVGAPHYLIEFETSNRQLSAEASSSLTLVDCDLSADSADGGQFQAIWAYGNAATVTFEGGSVSGDFAALVRARRGIDVEVVRPVAGAPDRVTQYY